LAIALATIGMGVATPAGASLDAAARCDRVASTSGSDAHGTGSAARPYRTPRKLLASLRPGESGCLRRGVYASPTRFTSSTRSLTLRSYPGERATLHGRLWIRGDGTTV